MHAYLYVFDLHRDFCDFGLVWSPYGIWMVDHLIYTYLFDLHEFAAVAVMVLSCNSTSWQVVDSKRGCER